MATIDTSKSTAKYDAAIAQQSQQPQLGATQPRGQQTSTQEQAGTANAQNSGANVNANAANGGTTQTTSNPLNDYTSTLSPRTTYNDPLLSDVLPSDGGTGEAALANGNAAAAAFLNSVDLTSSFLALAPAQKQDDTPDPNSPNSPGNKAASTNSSLKNSGADDTSSLFTSSDAAAMQLANVALERAQNQARADADANGADAQDPNNPANAPSASSAPSVSTQQTQSSQNQPQPSSTEQDSSTAQQQAREQVNSQTNANTAANGRSDDATPSANRPAGSAPADGRQADSELIGELNTFLQQQLGLINPKARALQTLLSGEQGLAEAMEGASHGLMGTRGGATVLGGLAGEGASIGGASLGELRGAMAMRGEAAVLGQAAAAMDSTVQNNARMLVMMMSNMPASGTSQPVLAMIAADIFRLQSMRLELMASLRSADEDGEMPPVDEDEAAMKRRQVQGIDLGGMWRWDLRPSVDAGQEEEQEEMPQVWFRTALLTCALQRPNTVAPMFQSTEDAHSVRLFEHDEDNDAFAERWVQIPAKQTALGNFNVHSEHFATWVNLAEQAFSHARLGPRPVVADDAAKNAKAQASALQAIVGKPTYALVRAFDDDEATRRTFFKAVCRSNSPKSLPTLITTRDATFQDDGLRPNFAYGVLGAFVKDGAWSVILCEDRGSDPKAVQAGPISEEGDKSFRIFSVPYQAVDRNAAAVVFLPG